MQHFRYLTSATYSLFSFVAFFCAPTATVGKPANVIFIFYTVKKIPEFPDKSLCRAFVIDVL